MPPHNVLVEGRKRVNRLPSQFTLDGGHHAFDGRIEEFAIDPEITKAQQGAKGHGGKRQGLGVEWTEQTIRPLAGKQGVGCGEGGWPRTV